MTATVIDTPFHRVGYGISAQVRGNATEKAIANRSGYFAIEECCNLSLFSVFFRIEKKATGPARSRSEHCGIVIQNYFRIKLFKFY